MFRVVDPVIVLLDVAVQGMSGLETLERVKQIKPDVSVIMISGQNDPEVIFRASKLGADDYLANLSNQKTWIYESAGLEKQRLPTEVTQLRDQVRRKAILRCCSAPARRWKSKEHHRAGGGDERDGSDPRRERHRKRSGCAHDLSQSPDAKSHLSK